MHLQNENTFRGATDFANAEAECRNRTSRVLGVAPSDFVS